MGENKSKTKPKKEYYKGNMKYNYKMQQKRTTKTTKLHRKNQNNLPTHKRNATKK